MGDNKWVPTLTVPSLADARPILQEGARLLFRGQDGTEHLLEVTDVGEPGEDGRLMVTATAVREGVDDEWLYYAIPSGPTDG